MAYVLVDDLTRVEITDPDHAPTEISVDGHAVEVDLSPESAEQLRELLAPYYEAGRTPSTSASPMPAEAAREWLDDVVVATSTYPPDIPPEAVLDAVEVPDDPPDAEPVPDAVIRTWARKYGIDCPASRQVSSGVRAMYAAVAGGAPKAGARATT
jgi:hypothetical protein